MGPVKVRGRGKRRGTGEGAGTEDEAAGVVQSGPSAI